ncbi:MAG: DegT/DnrJ/EryC1/StrS family aminotransferase [Actinomycetota bacterium]
MIPIEVPLLNPSDEMSEIRDEVDRAIDGVLSSGRYIGGPEVVGFEDEFSSVVGGRSVAAVNSGTDALQLGLTALGIGAGDEVIIPANTFTATAMAVQAIGAVPVIADVDEDLYVIRARAVEPLITSRTRCIIPVHLFGHPAPMEELTELAAAHGLKILEDAAQSHGATAHGRRVGSLGDAAAFSFYPSKNLGAFGDAGAVVGERELVERVRVLRDLGRDDEGAHVETGVNSRLDALQAAILRVKLRHFEDWQKERRLRAERYAEALADLPVGLPVEAAWAEHVFYVFVIRISQRDRILDALRNDGVGAQVHYPVPVHLQPAHRGKVSVPQPLPVSERLAGEILSLPLYPHLPPAAQDHVMDSLRRALERG